MFTFEWIGIDGAQKRYDKVLDAIPKIKAATVKAGSMMQTEARDKAPVDTGTLVKSIILTMAGALMAIVEAGVFYAGFVEFGTVKMRAQPFFIPSFESTARWYESELNKILRAA